MGKDGKLVMTDSVVDMSTGEIIERRGIYRKRSFERYVVLRTTVGLSWLDGMTGGDIKFFIHLLDLCDKMNRFHTPSDFRYRLCKLIDITDRTFYYYIGRLVTQDLLVRISSGYYMINPLYGYKGSFEQMHNKQVLYDRYRLAAPSDVSK